MSPSNALRWADYVANRTAVQEFLDHDDCEKSAVVKYKKLIADTDLTKPPTSDWYGLHLLTKNDKSVKREEDAWPMDLTAWGLNIWQMDLVRLLRELCEQGTLSRCKGSQNHNRPLLYSSAEKAYCAMPARFPNIHPDMIDRRWYIMAMQRIVLGCWQQSFIDLCDERYDRCTGLVNSSGEVHWIQIKEQWELKDRQHGCVSELKEEASKKRTNVGDEQEPQPKRRAA
jgi:hypothetical protein